MNPKLSDILDRESWELKSLSEIATDIYSGNGVTKEQLGTGDYPAVKSGNLSNINSLYFAKSNFLINGKLISNKKTFKYGDIITIANSGSTEIIGKSFLYLGEEECIAGTGIYVIKHNQNPRYLIHVFHTEFFKNQIKKEVEKTKVGGMPGRIGLDKFKNILIPLPPLEIQNQIADYLDKFTEMNSQLEAELEAELEERKIQYKYYRDELIIGRDEEEMKKRWQIKTLNEIATDIYSGTGVTKEQLGTGEYLAIKCGDINSKLPIQFTECISFVDENLIKNPKYFEHGDILISALAHNLETIGSVCLYLGTEKCLAGNHVVIIKHNQKPKYLAYVLSTEYCRKQIKEYAQKGTVYDLFISKIKQIKVPLPSLKEQEEIVSKLDKFYDLIGNLESGIPWLIQANRDQYKYYKNQIIRI